jgi:hypothetical protein
VAFLGSGARQVLLQGTNRQMTKPLLEEKRKEVFRTLVEL